MRVAIVGGPGIGKSTLVRQLGDLYHNGAYGEGEKGVWDPRVLDDIENERQSRRRHRVLRATSTTPITATAPRTTARAG